MVISLYPGDVADGELSKVEECLGIVGTQLIHDDEPDGLQHVRIRRQKVYCLDDTTEGVMAYAAQAVHPSAPSSVEQETLDQDHRGTY